MTLDDLDTPALVIDLDILEANIARTASYARSHGLRLRPHTKTHKSPALGRKQIEAGAVGLTVAKVSEAEVMLKAEPAELLLAYPLWGERKLDRLVEVARQASLTVSLDSLETARHISGRARQAGVEVGVLAEFDAGQGRVGVTPGPDLLDLVQGIRRLPHLRWEGLAFYPGHIKHVKDGAGDEAIESLSRLVGETVRMLESAGHAPRVVSGGSTPTFYHSHRIEGMNEVRPGTSIFHDRNCVVQGVADWDDCAATVLVTVVSTARPGQAIVDGGSKTFSSDGLVEASDGCHGRILEAPETRFFRMNEEHGYLALPPAQDRFHVGDRLRIIPNHICVAVNLHEQIYGIRGAQVEEVWPVEARGKLQ